jgi:energy-coupling factor transporter ATP-binding protein EcfA2
MKETQMIPITKLISAACRDFMAFRGAHSFEFKDGVNYIVGRNGEGKTSLVRLIIQALNPNISYDNTWGNYYSGRENESSLIELKFIADGKTHHIRRVLLGDSTSDLHLYIGEGENTQFLRDGQALNYLIKLKPISTINNSFQFRSQYRNFFHFSLAASPDAPFDEYHINDLNKILKQSNHDFTVSQNKNRELIVSFENGKIEPIGNLGRNSYNTIFTIILLLNIVNNIKDKNLSRVIVIDELDNGIQRKEREAIEAVIDLLSARSQFQFILTAKFKRGKVNVILVNGPNIPQVYHIENNNTNNSKSYQKWLKYVKASFTKRKKKSHIIFKSKWQGEI